MLPAADLYYLHSFEMHRAIAPAARRNGARIIYDAHDFYRGVVPAEAQPPFDRQHLRPFYNGLEARLVTAADAVVTVSNGVAEEMARVFGRRPEVIRNCHDDRRDRTGTPDLRTLIGLTAADRLCVLVGNCKPGMAVDAAIEAISRLPDRYHLACVGRGYEEVQRRLPCGPLTIADSFRACFRTRQSGAGHQVGRYRAAAVPALFHQLPACLAERIFSADCRRLALVRAPLAEVEAIIGRRQIGVCVQELLPEILGAAIETCAEGAAPMRAGAAALAAGISWRAEADRLMRLIGAVLQGPRFARSATSNGLETRNVADA